MPNTLLVKKKNSKKSFFFFLTSYLFLIDHPSNSLFNILGVLYVDIAFVL